MKTIEEKAKAYDEALKIARCWLNDPQTIQDCNYTIEDAIQNIFPQLRESEDERIRKQLINICNEWLSGGHSARPCLKDVRWLKNLLEKQQQKPAEWSEEDEKNFSSLCEFFTTWSEKHYTAYGRQEAMEEWLFNRFKYLNPQPKQEWSEKDKETIEILKEILRVNHPNGKFKTTEAGTIDVKYISTDEVISRLESLRPQPHWKPSEEQMEELWNVISYIEQPGSNFLGVPALLESLYEQLKKLCQ